MLFSPRLSGGTRGRSALETELGRRNIVQKYS